jgi:flavin reductase (DIM6/NTAB) family NADH-FMN oxidoreductase RutF
MMSELKTTLLNSVKIDAFQLIGEEWMLITGGVPDSFNMMTANWGGLGFLWGKNVTFCFVRPTRYTYEFIEKHDFYTISFFEEKYKKELNFCGSQSGRDTDKVKETGFTPEVSENGAVYFKEARLVFECRKIYTENIDPQNFLDHSIDKFYPKHDYHRMYIGEIVSVLSR